MRLALLAALSIAAPASAWQAYRGPDGQYLRWQSWPLQLKLLPPGAGAIAPQGWDLAARRALQTWQAVEIASASVRYAGSASGSAPPAGEVWLGLDGAGFPSTNDVVGKTELWTDSAHAIVAARVHLNARDFRWATDGSTQAIDVQSIAAHELGHALGLAHPCGDAGTAAPSCDALPLAERADLQNDVMWPWATPGPRRALAEDDRQGLAALLPVSAPEPAPILDAAIPACATNLSGLALQLNAPLAAGADRLVVAGDGAALADVPAQRNSSGVLAAQLPAGFSAPPGAASLDLLLVASATGKAGELPAGLALRNCHAGGCGTSSENPLWAMAALPLALLLFRRRSLPAALGAGFLLFAALPAQAYKRSTAGPSGPCLFWSTRGHSFQIDAKGTPDVADGSAFDAIRKSFATWAAVACSDLTMPDLGLSTDPNDRKVGYVPGAYNRNLVLFRTANCGLGAAPPNDPCFNTPGSCANQYDCWDKGDQVIAVTTTTFNRSTGQIYDADIEVNDAPHQDGSKFRFTTYNPPASCVVNPPPAGCACTSNTQSGCVDYDIQNTITHEAGHSLGLDHTPSTVPDFQDQTMFANAQRGETTKRTLHPDDVQAICDIYPRGKPTSTCLGDPITLTNGAASDGGGCGCSSRGSGAPLWTALIAAALFALRRRRVS